MKNHFLTLATLLFAQLYFANILSTTSQTVQKDATPIVLLNTETSPTIQNPLKTINIDKIPHHSMYDVVVYPEDTLTFKTHRGILAIAKPEKHSTEATYLDFNTDQATTNKITALVPFVKEKSWYIFNCSKISSLSSPQSFVRVTVLRHPTIVTQESDNPKDPIMQNNRILLEKVPGTYRLKIKSGSSFFFSLPANTHHHEYEYGISQEPGTPVISIINANGIADNPFPKERIFKVTTPHITSQSLKYSIKLLRIELFYDKPWHIIKNHPVEVSHIELEIMPG